MKYYTVKETAKICHKHPNIIYRWIKEGKLPAGFIKGKYRSQIRIAEIDIPTYLRINGKKR